PQELAAKRNVYREKLPDDLLDEVWQRFREALFPLHSAGKLGAVLFQFPQWFVIGRGSKDYILECKERRQGYGSAVEVRDTACRGDPKAAESLDLRARGDMGS